MLATQFGAAPRRKTDYVTRIVQSVIAHPEFFRMGVTELHACSRDKMGGQLGT